MAQRTQLGRLEVTFQYKKEWFSIHKLVGQKMRSSFVTNMRVT